MTAYPNGVWDSVLSSSSPGGGGSSRAPWAARWGGPQPAEHAWIVCHPAPPLRGDPPPQGAGEGRGLTLRVLLFGSRRRLAVLGAGADDADLVAVGDAVGRRDDD